MITTSAVFTPLVSFTFLNWIIAGYTKTLQCRRWRYWSSGDTTDGGSTNSIYIRKQRFSSKVRNMPVKHSDFMNWNVRLSLTRTNIMINDTSFDRRMLKCLEAMQKAWLINQWLIGAVQRATLRLHWWFVSLLSEVSLMKSPLAGEIAWHLEKLGISSR